MPGVLSSFRMTISAQLKRVLTPWEVARFSQATRVDPRLKEVSPCHQIPYYDHQPMATIRLSAIADGETELAASEIISEAFEQGLRQIGIDPSTLTIRIDFAPHHQGAP